MLKKLILKRLTFLVPDGIGLEDPVRMYLKEIGKSAAFYQQRKKLNLQNKWSKANENGKNVLQKPI